MLTLEELEAEVGEGSIDTVIDCLVSAKTANTNARGSVSSAPPSIHVAPLS